MSDYRVTVKVRNARLLRAINNAGFQSIPKFCEAAGVCYAQVNDLINMTTSPLGRNMKVRPMVEALMDFLCEPFDALFSEAQCEALATNKTERDVSAEQVFALMSSESTDPYDLLDTEQTRVAVSDALEMLVPRTRKVIELRAEGKTWVEVGAAIGVSDNRAIQIAEKGIRTMRHPSISSSLRKHLPDGARWGVDQ